MSQGFIALHRKIKVDWKWSKPQWAYAWIWMLMEAAWEDADDLKRGQLKLTTRQLASVAQMSQSAANRFLEKCRKEVDIIWEKARCNALSQRGDSERDSHGDSERDSDYSLITICNYDLYQLQPNCGDSERDSEADSGGDSLLNNKKEVQEQYIASSNSEEEKEQKPKKPKRTKDEQLQAIKAKFPEYQEKFPYRNIPEHFDMWLDWMEEKGKRPKKYEASFRNFCRVKPWEKGLKEAIETGMFNKQYDGYQQLPEYDPVQDAKDQEQWELLRLIRKLPQEEQARIEVDAINRGGKFGHIDATMKFHMVEIYKERYEKEDQ